MAAQTDRFAAEQIDTPQAVLQMPDKAQPGRAIASGFGSIVLREHAADDVFVDIAAKGPRDLLGDAGTADPAIAAVCTEKRLLRKVLKAWRASRVAPELHGALS